MNFGTYFAEKRNEKEISLRQMARLLGISAPYLGDVEHGRRKPLEIEKLTAMTGNHPKYLGWVPLVRVLNQEPYINPGLQGS